MTNSTGRLAISAFPSLTNVTSVAPYCMPAEIFGADYNFLSNDQLLSFDEIERLARLFVQLGVTKLRMTGGEPLIRPNLPDLLARLARIPNVDDFALTTNAYYLPKFAHDLKQSGLHRLTISLDSLDDDVFQQMNGYKSSVGSGFCRYGGGTIGRF